MNKNSKEYLNFKNKILKKLEAYSHTQLYKMKAYGMYYNRAINPSWKKLHQIAETIERTRPIKPKRGRIRQHDQATIDKILKMRNQGRTHKYIAKQLDMTNQQVGLIYNYYKKKEI
jgi:hypothetical protein